MSGAIEALHIYDENNKPILSHTYTSRPLSAAHLLPLYLAHPVPRPSLVYLPNTNPPTLIFSLVHSNLLFLVTSSSELEPLLALEFLHRVIDIFEDFLGAPLLSSKIEASYDVVAQLLNEMCDAGAVSTTEGNALREIVEVEGVLGRFMGGLGLPGKSGPSNLQTSNMPGISSLGSAQNTPALPWRRANVRHTSNELYVDLVESLTVTIAPSGRPLSAFAHGTIAFTAKISGVPDLLLILSSPSGKHNLDSVMELPVFHPCVRLQRWKSSPGELSFVPPDGRFILAGYEVDLLPFTSGKVSQSSANLKLPVNLEVKTSLGPTGAEFEVRLLLSKIAGPNSNSSSSSLGSDSRAGGLGRGGSGLGGGFGSNQGTTSSPLLEEIVVSVPIPADVRTLLDIRPSRGEISYNPGDPALEWRLSSKETGSGAATLRATVVSLTQDDDDLDGNGFSFDGTSSYDYNEDALSTYRSSEPAPSVSTQDRVEQGRDEKRIEKNKILMPSSARVSFSVKGWLPSGIKVESLTVDKAKSRGLGDGVRPYKGVKYLTVSRGGVEVRC